MSIGTHWEDCWRQHTKCAHARIERLEREVERLREALQVVRIFGIFTTYDPNASDQENDELQRQYRRVRKALDDALAAPGEREGHNRHG